MTALSAAVDEKLKQYQKLQTDIQVLFSQKQEILSRFNENTLVKGELDMLEGGSKVYKLVGPVLMTIELDEARENVQKRLEFIQNDVEKVEAAIDVKQKEQKDVGDAVAEIQQRMQAEAAEAARQIADSVTA